MTSQRRGPSSHPRADTSLHPQSSAQYLRASCSIGRCPLSTALAEISFHSVYSVQDPPSPLPYPPNPPPSPV
ncbi:hypothetical protein I7I53_00488 [Histoplasma capsulatum var. duboisii H88]|uniref:Uncharacterized protein n=1 Tax=Ajellomyces capsulatus (strain H88) TaxID=544711 RepID=A0A8A1LKW0_AJEC8|nr:hypothetical protein I7I53_00488 [Histoplasma capsulatum var. duboisii H88]